MIKMVWEDVLKMPPIRNPRENERGVMPNDNLSMDEYEKLFEEIVDPVIEERAKSKQRFAYINVGKLKMSPKRAEEIAQKLYEGLGYEKIYVDRDDDLAIQLYQRWK